MQLANSHVPFGGVGNSGMGSYHGKHGFDLLSHKKGIVKNKTIFDLPFRYAPFDLKNLNIFKHIMWYIYIWINVVILKYNIYN